MLMPLKLQKTTNYTKLKKSILEKIMNKSKQNSPRLKDEDEHRYSLPCTPRMTDPDFKDLISKFPIMPSIDELHDINIKKLSKNKVKIANLIKQ
jgi:hypothetical protein